MSNGFERPGWDEYFMLQAKLAALRSNCMTRSVGAVIVRDSLQQGIMEHHLGSRIVLKEDAKDAKTEWMEK